MHPYSEQPSQSFWRRHVATTPWSEVDFVGQPRFKLSRRDQVSTAGSCFAQHISRHMRLRGMTPLQAEHPHPLAIAAGGETASYQAFSARYGNVYTARQCLELFEQAFGLRAVVHDHAMHDGRYYDLLRPNAVPGGFGSLEEARADRVFHLGRVRQMFERSDVFVFTLGLTESWYHAASGHTYPVCPGTAKGEYDPEQHRFRNLTQSEVVADLLALVEGLRRFNPRLRIIFTVSPVPLVATYTSSNVLVASTYSKAVLRAAAGEVVEKLEQVLYFPSFEIISHPASFGQYLQGDLREVTERGVSHVMRCFFSTLYDDAQAEEAPTAPQATAAPDIGALLQGECEEMLNDFQRPSQAQR